MTSDKNDSASQQRIDAATRKAIHDTFPMGIIMKSGADNPLTIHSADPLLFRAMYCLIAETLSVTTGLDRSTKEKIATLVSERNKCPVCIVAHTMMETVASEVEETKETDTASILKHAESVLDALEDTRRGKLSSTKKTEEDTTSSTLDEATKAEIALVVLVFDHMNRVVSAIMGEEMSTAMMGIPRIIARQMEKPTIVATMSRWLSGLLGGPFTRKNEPGMTRRALFVEGEEASETELPDHLMGVKLAGNERAIAVARLLEWSKTYETELLEKGGFFSEDLVTLLDRAIAQKAVEKEHHPGKIIQWANACVEEDFRSELEKLDDQDAGSTVAALLLCLSLAPQGVYQSSRWNETIQKLGGSSPARCIVFWWSLRMTLRDAAGLNSR